MVKDSKMKKMISQGSRIIQSGVTASLTEGLVSGTDNMPAAFATGALSQVWEIFLNIGNDFSERSLSTREGMKVGALFAMTAQKINDNFENQKSLRLDSFFEPNQFERSSFEEIAEGVFLACQRENEEKKIKYMAHLLANISCDESISKEVGNQLVRTLESLSYRQILLLALVGAEQQLPDGFHSFPIKKDCLNGYNEISIYQDLFELFQKGLIRDADSNIIMDVTQINLRKTEVIGNGALLYNLTELNNPKRLDSIENVDRMRVVLQINNHDIPMDLEKYELLFSEGKIRIRLIEKA